MDIWKDNTAPTVSDTVTVDGVAQDLTGATLTFKMRGEDASDADTLKVNAAASFVTDGSDGEWTYAWQAADTDTPGDYVAWLHIALSNGKTQDTPEFQVRVLDHGLSSGSLCAVADVREALQLPDSQTDEDTLIQALILGASETIMNECGREFAPKTTETRRYRFDPQLRDRNGLFVVRFNWREDLRAATTVELDPEEASPTVLSSTTGYLLEPQRPMGNVYDRLKINPRGLGDAGYSFSSTAALYWGFAYIDVTGDWGFASVPEEVKRCCINVVRSWLQRDLSQLAGLVQTEPGLAPVVPVYFDLPSFAHLVIDRWRRQLAF